MKRQSKLILAFAVALLAASILAIPRARAEAPLTEASAEALTAVETLWNNAQVALIAAHYFDKVAENDPRFTHVSLYFRGRASAYAEAYRIMGGTRTL
jgi:hypothetical protein